MPKVFKYIFNKWEDELLNIANEAIECAIASAYLSTSGVDFLSKVANRLAEFTIMSSHILGQDGKEIKAKILGKS